MITSILFSCLTLGTAAIAIRYLFTATGTSHARRLTISIVLWLAFTAVLAVSGTLSDYSILPTPAMRVMIPGLFLTLVLALSSIGKSLATNASMRGLVLFQAFRIPLEIMLYLLHREGHIPVEMTFSGMNFDILTGISAVVLYFAMKRGSLAKSWIWLWNIGGLALLVNIVTIAILSMPGRTHVLNTAVPNMLISEFPYVWITFFVLAALFGHIVIFRKLRMSQETQHSVATRVAI